MRHWIVTILLLALGGGFLALHLSHKETLHLQLVEPAKK